VQFSVNRHVIQPELSRVVSALHDIENAEAIEHRAIGFVAGVESHDGGIAAKRGGDSAPTARAIGIVAEGKWVVRCAAGGPTLWWNLGLIEANSPTTFYRVIAVK
jgi:hypothetical protein